jgi:hypothetical protein
MHCLDKFINTAVGEERTDIGHGLASCTFMITAVPVAHPGDQGTRVVLIDTPGFDDAEIDDTLILHTISEFLFTK